jgi:hypothetical protein
MDHLLVVWDCFRAFVKTVPDVVWSGIVASLITVLGVLVTNWGLSTRHRQQLQHTEEENARKRTYDASESALDRKMKLRRDVYIPAAEAVLNGVGSIVMMVDPSIPKAEITQRYFEAVATIGKANSIAGVKTVAAVGKLLVCMGNMNIDMSMQRGMIDQICNQLAANNGAIEKAVQNHGRWVETQTSMLFEGPPDPTKWNLVQNQINFWQAQIGQWTAARDNSVVRLQRAQLAALKVLAGFQPKFIDLSVDAGIALRTELALQDDDLDELRTTLRQNGDLAQTNLQNAIVRLESLLDQIADGQAR